MFESCRAHHFRGSTPTTGAAPGSRPTPTTGALRQQRGQPRIPGSPTQHFDSLSIVSKLRKPNACREIISIFGMKTFGDSVVAGEAPHGSDLVAPGVERVAEGGQLRKPGLPEFVDGAEEPGGEGLALMARAVFLQK